MKQRIKLLLLRLSSYIYKNGESKVIYYHDIHAKQRYTGMSTPVDLFRKHLEIIREEGYTIVDKIRNPQKEIEITFDDGFRGLYDNFDFFVDNKVPVKLFLIPDYMGGPNYVSEKEVSEMLATGMLRIGSHTMSHRNLDELDEDEVHLELKTSKAFLEREFNANIDEICYPRGRFNRRIIELCREHGYTTQYSCLPGSYSKPFAEGVLRRNFVQHATPEEFRYHLHGAGELFYKRYLKQHFRDANAY